MLLSLSSVEKVYQSVALVFVCAFSPSECMDLNNIFKTGGVTRYF